MQAGDLIARKQPLVGSPGLWLHSPTCFQAGMESLSIAQKQKANERHHRAEVMIAGEQLRYVLALSVGRWRITARRCSVVVS
ncbi:UNVERIFIED_CONTAM: hypothetical protein K2H54_070344 [Gekko kuhli]